ncbi:MAG: hypothetical protein HQL21_06315 [Candidatus Omnitrophica bacterium]|nr:hypothetical protein [Candidatus Omnitrophota bacterium]
MFAGQEKTVKADGVRSLMETAADLVLDIAKKAEALVPNVAPTKNVTADGVIMTHKPVKQMEV